MSGANSVPAQFSRRLPRWHATQAPMDSTSAGSVPPAPVRPSKRFLSVWILLCDFPGAVRCSPRRSRLPICATVAIDAQLTTASADTCSLACSWSDPSVAMRAYTAAEFSWELRFQPCTRIRPASFCFLLVRRSKRKTERRPLSFRQGRRPRQSRAICPEASGTTLSNVRLAATMNPGSAAALLRIRMFPGKTSPFRQLLSFKLQGVLR